MKIYSKNEFDIFKEIRLYGKIYIKKKKKTRLDLIGRVL